MPNFGSQNHSGLNGQMTMEKKLVSAAPIAVA